MARERMSRLVVIDDLKFATKVVILDESWGEHTMTEIIDASISIISIPGATIASFKGTDVRGGEFSNTYLFVNVFTLYDYTEGESCIINDRSRRITCNL
jgi:hypothetical protein